MGGLIIAYYGSLPSFVKLLTKDTMAIESSHSSQRYTNGYRRETGAFETCLFTLCHKDEFRKQVVQAEF